MLAPKSSALADNGIDDAGAKSLARGLAANRGLTKVHLACEWGGRRAALYWHGLGMLPAWWVRSVRAANESACTTGAQITTSGRSVGQLLPAHCN